MRLGRIVGPVWAERKAPSLRGCPLYVVQPVSSDGAAAGWPLVAADPGRLSGPGDTVVYVTSTDAAQAFDSGFAPVNASVVERVDSIG